MKNKISILEIYLGDVFVGYLSHTPSGKNTFIFEKSYIDLGSNRPLLSLSFLEEAQLNYPQVSSQSLPPFFSNVLPEGTFREYIVQTLKLKESSEFHLFKALSGECPGNLIVKCESEESSNRLELQSMIKADEKIKNQAIQFSLAGVQLKFSMFMMRDRYTISFWNHPGTIIAKMPSLIYPKLPENEYSMMHLAKAVGISIPDIKLIPLKQMGDLGSFKHLENELVYTIRRFDRAPDGTRIHCEDFAQALGVRPHEKYNAANYETMARVIKEVFPNGIQQLAEFLKRLFLSILLGNTDAHLKNWTLLFQEGNIPMLAPAYDIVSTLEYIPENRELALNFAKTKNFYDIDTSVVEKFADRIPVPRKFVLEIADELVQSANQNWPSLFQELPISPETREALRKHWRKLKTPFNLSDLSKII